MPNAIDLQPQASARRVDPLEVAGANRFSLVNCDQERLPSRCDRHSSTNRLTSSRHRLHILLRRRCQAAYSDVPDNPCFVFVVQPGQPLDLPLRKLPCCTACLLPHSQRQSQYTLRFSRFQNPSTVHNPNVCPVRSMRIRGGIGFGLALLRTFIPAIIGAFHKGRGMGANPYETPTETPRRPVGKRDGRRRFSASVVVLCILAAAISYVADLPSWVPTMCLVLGALVAGTMLYEGRR